MMTSIFKLSEAEHNLTIQVQFRRWYRLSSVQDEMVHQFKLNRKGKTKCIYSVTINYLVITATLHGYRAHHDTQAK